MVDLGSGGGVPALVLALARPELTWVLVEARKHRAEWLAGAVAALGLDARVEVVGDRAELLGRGRWRGSATGVTAQQYVTGRSGTT